MQCYVYRSPRRADTYIYLPHREGFSAVPEPLMKLFGPPEFALEFVLTPQRRLVREEAVQVLGNLLRQGFHLQIPSENRHPV
ncbi:MAG: YcgL domain-containing protein [Ectothiorhodospira sp.]